MLPETEQELARILELDPPPSDQAWLIGAFIHLSNYGDDDHQDSDLYVSHYKIPKVPLNVSITNLRKLWVDVAVGIGWAIATGGQGGFETVSLVVAHALTLVRSLSEDESELVHVILHISRGHAYHASISEKDLHQAYEDATLDLDHLVQGLEKKGVLTRTDGRVQLIF